MIYHEAICTQTDDVIILSTSSSAMLLQKVALRFAKLNFCSCITFLGSKRETEINKKTKKTGNSAAREFKFKKSKKRNSFLR